MILKNSWSGKRHAKTAFVGLAYTQLHTKFQGSIYKNGGTIYIAWAISSQLGKFGSSLSSPILQARDLNIFMKLYLS